MADGSYIEFRKIDERIARDQKRNRKTRITSPLELREQMWVIHSDYTIYLEIWTKFGTELKRQTTIVPNSITMKIQDGSERHIDFRKMSISPGQATGNKCKTLSAYMSSRALAMTTTSSVNFDNWYRSRCFGCQQQTKHCGSISWVTLSDLSKQLDRLQQRRYA